MPDEGTRVVIPLKKIVHKLFKTRDLEPLLELIPALKPEELELIMLMRANDFDSINIKMESGNIELIEASETVDAQEKIHKLLLDHNYQEIALTQKNGNVVKVKRKVTVVPKQRAKKALVPSNTGSNTARKPKRV